MGVVTARVAGVARRRRVRAAGAGRRHRPGRARRLPARRRVGASTGWAGRRRSRRSRTGPSRSQPVDVIVGPGNLYVQEAKRQVFGQVGIDGFAGPSDLLVIADADADPEPLALDLLAQAEHGPGTLVIAISTSDRAARARSRSGSTRAPDTGAVAALVAGRRRRSPALALAQAFAPEHLQLVGAQSEALAPRATHAGCVFVGPSAGTAFGDYIAGSNHVLPTNGAARFASALSPRTLPAQLHRGADPRRLRSWRAQAAPVARAEGFELHAQVDGGAHRRQWPGWREPLRSTARPARPTFSVSLALDGDGAGERDDGRRLLRPHARPARAARPARSDRRRPAATSSRPARITRSRTSASASARRSTRRSATAPGSPATARRRCRWTSRAPRARSTSRARGFCSFEASAAARRDRQLRPRARRGVLSRAGDEREADAAPDRRAGHERPPRDRGGVQGASRERCAARSRSTRPSAASRARRARSYDADRDDRVVDYGMGNRRSVQKALEHVGASAAITRDHDELNAADGLVVPGVGAFPLAMANLRELGPRRADPGAGRAGHPDPRDLPRHAAAVRALRGARLDRRARADRRRGSLARHRGLRIPHIGWNEVRFERPSPLTEGLPAARMSVLPRAFARGAVRATQATSSARTEYGERFATIVARGLGVRRPVPPGEVLACTACGCSGTSPRLCSGSPKRSRRRPAARA